MFSKIASNITAYTVLFYLIMSIKCTSISISEVGRTQLKTVNIGGAVILDSNILSYRTNSIKKVMYSYRDKQIKRVENLPQLRSIFLERVNQQIIPEFKNVLLLSDVYMTANNFVFIKSENFGYTNTVYLFLRFNNIQYIEDESFGPKTKHLYLQCNKLNHFNPDWFRNPAVLNVLDLDENNIQYIEENAFKKFKNLEYIYISSNGLKQIGSFAFSGNNFISELWLGTNDLTDLPTNIFGNNKMELERLDLTYNKLTYLPKEFFQRVNVTVTLSVDSNPWQCSCYYYHIIPWGGSRISFKESIPGEPRCVGELGPPSTRCVRLRDRTLIDIYNKEISPSPKDKNFICTRMIV